MSLIFFEDYADSFTIPENTAMSNTSNSAGRVANSGNGQGEYRWTGINELYLAGAMNGHNGAAANFITIRSGGVGATPQLTVRAENGFIVLRRGNTGGTIIATAAVPDWVTPTVIYRSTNIWATLADTGGRCVVKVDGVTRIDFTGDTLATGVGTATITGLLIGGGTSADRLADLVVCDEIDGTGIGQSLPFNTFPGDLNCIRVTPAANGNYTAFTPSTGVNHAALVDELPANTSDYNTSTAAGQKDSYTLTDLPATASVLAVRETAYVAKTDAGAQGVKPFIREGGTDTLHATSYPLSTTFAYYAGIVRTVCPSTGVAWTVANVNGLEAGVESEAA